MTAPMRVTLSWLPDYDISEDGLVRRITYAKTRAEVPYTLAGCRTPRKDGYCSVKLILPSGRKIVARVHKLVCEAFHGPQPSPIHHAAHWDGNSVNNHFSNLRWATPKENVGDDRRRHGTSPAGMRNGRAKLSNEQVSEIRAAFTGAHGEIAELARQYNMSHSGMRSVCRSEHWQ